MLLHCVRTVCICQETHPISPATCLLARHSSKAHKITTELPSNWYTNVPIKKPHSLERDNYAVACKMHTSSGKCHTRLYHEDGGHTLATNTIIFLLLNGCLLLCQHRLEHMMPRGRRPIPSLPANTKLSNVEQNTHMAMQLRCKACPHIADNPPLPQACKEVPHMQPGRLA